MDGKGKSLSIADRVEQQLGNYRLICSLEQGRFSGAYLGEHVYLKAQGVVEVLQTRLADDLVDNFLKQTCMLAQLVHPHILRLRDSGVEDLVPFLVMDYVPHITLHQSYPKGVSQPLAKILPHLKQVVGALQYAHDSGILHKNIRPKNMLLGWNNEVLLSDFAIDAVAQSRRNRLGPEEVIESVAYMAPEQVQNKACPASDQYALAVVLYEWLSGDLPFRGSHVEIIHQHMHVPPPSLRQKVPTISSEVEYVILTALAKHPQRRFASVSAFINALEQASRSAILPSSTRAISRPAPTGVVPCVTVPAAPVPSLLVAPKPFLPGAPYSPPTTRAQPIPVLTYSAPAPYAQPVPTTSSAPTKSTPPPPQKTKAKGLLSRCVFGFCCKNSKDLL